MALGASLRPGETGLSRNPCPCTLAHAVTNAQPDPDPSPDRDRDRRSDCIPGPVPVAGPVLWLTARPRHGSAGDRLARHCLVPRYGPLDVEASGLDVVEQRGE